MNQIWLAMIVKISFLWLIKVKKIIKITKLKIMD